MGNPVKWYKQRNSVEKYGIGAAVVGIVSLLGVMLFAFSQAATGPRLYVLPSAQTLTSGSDLSVTIRTDTVAESVNSVQASLGYDAGQLQFVGLEETGPFSFVAASDTSTPGRVRVARAIPQGAEAVAGDHAVVTVKFKVLASSGSVALTFDESFSMLVRESDNTNVLAATTGANYTFASTSGPEERSATMTLNPATNSVAQNSTYTVTLKTNSGTALVNSVQAAVNFDPAKVQFLSIVEGSVFPNQAATDTSTAGKIRIARSVQSGSGGVSGENDVVTISFKLLAASGSTDMTVDKAASFVVTADDNKNILSTVAGSTVTTAGGGQTDPATLSMTPASGSFAKDSTVAVAVKVKSQTTNVTTVQSTFTYPVNQLEYVSTTEGGVFPTAQRTKIEGGVVDIIRGVSGGQSGVTGENPVVTVNFKVIGTSGAAALAFTNTSAVFDNTGTGVSILDLASSTGASYTVTAPVAVQDCTANPSTPGVPTRTTFDYTTISMSWTASNAGSNCTLGGYRVLRNNAVIATVTNGTTYTDSGRTAGVSYDYAVQAFDTAGHNSTTSATASLTTKADDVAPTTPAGVSAAATSAASISLNWTASTDQPNPGGSGVDGYHIYRNGATTPTYSVTSGTTKADNDVTASTAYSYTIRAYDKSGNISAPSNVVTATTPTAPCSGKPTTPGGFNASGTTLTTVNLSWTASTASQSCELAGYKVYRGSALAGTVTGLSFTDTNLTPGTQYSYTVRAYDTGANHSDPSQALSVSTAADTSAPTAPETVTATVVSAGRIDLSWSEATDNTGVTGYRLYRNNTLLRTESASARSFNDTLVAPSTAYTYTVSAIDAAGNESAKTATDPTQVTTPAAPDTQAPTVPADLRRLASTSTAIAIAWDASTDNTAVSGYHVYRNGQFLQDSTTTNFTDEGLNPNTTYTYAVRAFDASGNESGPSNSLQVQTQAAPVTNPDPVTPTVPTNPTTPTNPTPTPTNPQQANPTTPPVTRITPVSPGGNVRSLPMVGDEMFAVESAFDVQPYSVQPDGISKIEYYLDNKLIKTVNIPPYAHRIDTPSMLNGSYKLTTKTYYTNGTTNTVNQTMQVTNKFGLTQLKLIVQKYAGLMLLLVILLVAAVAALIMRRNRTPGASGNGAASGSVGGPGGGNVVAPSA